MSDPTRILLVEDNRGDARLVEEMLSEFGDHFAVETVARLADGLERLRSAADPIDAVLLDLGLPDSQGLDTLRTLRAAAPGLAIVVLTGLDDDELGLETVKAGAQDYLPKNRLDVRFLARVIRYALERTRSEVALRDLEVMRDVAEEVAGLGNWKWDLASKRSSWSPGMFRLWDVDPDEFDGDVMPILAQRVHPVDLPALLETIAAVRQTGEPIPVEFRLILRDGTQRIVSSEAKADRDADGNVVTITGYYQDVTARRRAESDMRASRTFLDSIVEHSPHAMWISDAHGTLIRQNQACRDLLQITDDEVVGTYNILHDTLVEEQGRLPAVRRVFENGETARFSLDYPTVRLGGIVLERTVDLHLEVTVSPVFDEAGKVAHAIIQHVDTTDRVRAEQALRSSEARYRSLFENMAEGVAVHDIVYRDGKAVDYRFVEVNSAFEHHTGITSDGAVGALASAVFGSDGAPYLDEYARVAETGQTTVFENFFEPLGKHFRVTAVRLKPGSFATVFEDVSERLAAERTLRETEILRRSEGLYREMFDGHSAVMFLTDPETGDIVTANQAAADYFGVTIAAFETMTVRDFSCSPREGLTSGRDAAMTGGQTVFGDVYRLADGSCRDVEVRMVPIRLRDRDLLYAIVFDVTERRAAEEALRLSERTLAEAQRLAHAGHWVWDLATHAVTASDETCRILGRGVDDVPSGLTDLLAMVAAEDRDRVREALIAAAAGAPQVTEFAILRPDGTRRDVHQRIENQTDGDARPVRLVATIQDVTDRVRAETILRVNVELMAESSERSMESVLRQVAEAAEVVTDSSIGLFHVIDWGTEQILMRVYSRRTLEECDLGADPERAFDGLWERIVMTRSHFLDNGKGHTTLPAGHIAVHRFLAVPIFDGGEVVAVIAVGNKTTDYDEADILRLNSLAANAWVVIEQRRALAAVRERERQLAEAQRIAHVGSWSWNAATAETARSEETCRIYGCTSAEMGTDQDSWLASVHPDDRVRAREVTERAVTEAQSYTVDFRVVWRDGSEHVVRDSGEPVLDNAGRVISMWGYLQDITEQRRLEDALRQRAEELELFNRAMVDRELRIVSMKEAVNASARRLGEEPPYPEIWRESGGGAGGAAR